MKKVLGLIIVAALMLTLPIGALAQTLCGTPGSPACSTDLIAGNPKITRVVVGQVLYWTDCTNLYVKYVIDGDLTPNDPSDDGVPTLIYKTHLAVATSLNDIPQANGNAVPGKFKPNSREYNPGVPSDQYIVSLSSVGAVPGDKLFIAAHAVVKKLGGLAGLELGLPATATVSVTYPVIGGPSYFPTVTVTNDGHLNGAYNGWCVDTDHVIYENTPYVANVYSSYENITGLGLVEYPQNFDLVNWILNQNYIGKPSACGGNYTYGDIEYAIWSLIDDQTATSGLDGWSACRAAEIVAAAQASGEGFEPGCGQEVAVLLAPIDNAQVIIAQVIFAELDVPCSSESETARGDGFGFPGKNWSTYFTFTPGCAQ